MSPQGPLRSSVKSYRQWLEVRRCRTSALRQSLWRVSWSLPEVVDWRTPSLERLKLFCPKKHSTSLKLLCCPPSWTAVTKQPLHTNGVRFWWTSRATSGERNPRPPRLKGELALIVGGGWAQWREAPFGSLCLCTWVFGFISFLRGATSLTSLVKHRQSSPT